MYVLWMGVCVFKTKTVCTPRGVRVGGEPLCAFREETRYRRQQRQTPEPPPRRRRKGMVNGVFGGIGRGQQGHLFPSPSHQNLFFLFLAYTFQFFENNDKPKISVWVATSSNVYIGRVCYRLVYLLLSILCYLLSFGQNRTSVKGKQC